MHRTGGFGLAGNLGWMGRHGVHRLAEDPHRGPDVLAVRDERRARRDGWLAACEHEQAPNEARPLDLFGEPGIGELHADHQALAADVEHAPGMALPDLAETGEQLRTALGGVVDDGGVDEL